MSTLMSGLGGTLRRRTVLTASQEKAVTKNQQQPFSVFRVDPSTLPHVEDNGAWSCAARACRVVSCRV
jgi:hypothetical protein